MGNSRFDNDAYRSYSSTHNLDTASRDQIFLSRHMPQALDPTKIVLRESCDSVANPNSTPIILGLDVTGSMGFVAQNIATKNLPKLMERIYETQPITDPHVMFMGIGDVTCDNGPLQVSQFEAGSIELIAQLRELWLEGGGGGNSYESYDLPWYFAAHKTAIDSHNKRGKKGYIFTMGDEHPPTRALTASDVRRVFNNRDLPAPPDSVEKLLELVQEKYRVFHLVIEEGNFARGHLSAVRNSWTELLGPNAIFVRDIRFLPDIICAALAVAEGSDLTTIIEEAGQAQSELVYAFKNLIRSEV